ncbi:hypothetical protein [Nocardiopsis suaedae]|uniref:CopG family transcriptional regulator n=1 Tax=Nocardiopsis suaedae TaxID=3018444 RepID=A0ABT4TUC8_9ACTN|nr:hypothetical protein [Nocardiopsis suaedae]MDA2808290.1 hypothetical protein [Nocardiopsis suaedae]
MATDSKAGAAKSAAAQKRLEKAAHKATSEHESHSRKGERRRGGEADEARTPMRKVSVTLPAELTDAVQERVGRGEFSSYVAAAVARQIEHDLLVDLADRMDEEDGPVAEELVREAGAEWPDV